MSYKVTVPARQVMRETVITVRLTGIRWAERRIRVSMLLFRFAIWVGGFGGVEFTPPTLSSPESPE